MPTIEETRDFIRHAHSSQTDKAGEPYHTHVERVMLRVGVKIASLSTRLEMGDKWRENVLHAALLHDVVEDTEFSLNDLAARGYSPETLEMVGLVTRDRKDGLTYQQWIQQIAESGNLGAILIKLSDNEDNSDVSRIRSLPPEEQSIVSRYERSMKKLNAALMKMGLAVAE